MAGDLIAEGLGFGDLLERYDAAVEGARAAGYAGLKSIAAYRSGLAIRRWSAAEAERGARAPARAGVTRVQEQALVDFLLLRALPSPAATTCRVQLHAGYGDRDLDLRSVNPLHLRGMLSSDEAEGVHFVVLHAAWPYVREGAFLTAVYANVTLDVATCIPPLGHAALLEAWRCALAVGAINRLHASTRRGGAARAHRARRHAGALDARPGAGRARRDRRALAPARPSAPARRSSPGTRGGCISASPEAIAGSKLERAFDQTSDRLPYFAASPPLPGRTPHDPTHPSHRAARARGLCAARRADDRLECLRAHRARTRRTPVRAATW